MAFNIDNIKEVGGPGNSEEGGQVYSLWSDADTIATMLASGYLDDIAYKLNVRDVIFLTGTDGAVMAQIEAISTSDVVTTSITNSLGAGIQALSGPGAANITDLVTQVTTTGADAVTLANGAVGQIKIVTLVVDGGNMTLTPATRHGYATITFADAGDTVQLYWGSALGWLVLGQGGVGTGPLVA